jgi:hypothetical protein
MHDHHPDTGRPAGAAEPANSTATPRPAPNEGEQPGASHSMGLMVLCCVPMVLIAIALLIGAFVAR